MAANPNLVAAYDSDTLSTDQRLIIHFSGHGTDSGEVRRLVIEPGQHMDVEMLIEDSQGRRFMIDQAAHGIVRCVLDRERATSRLLAGALHRLPDVDRERYAEEWAADLDSITGRFARWRWLVGIRLNARRLAKPGRARAYAAPE